MKKFLALLFSMACVLALAGCGGSDAFRTYQIEDAERLVITSSSTGQTVTVTDPEVIDQITGDVNRADFYRGNTISLFCPDWNYRLRWYSRGTYDDLYYWVIGDGEINTALLDELLSL